VATGITTTSFTDTGLTDGSPTTTRSPPSTPASSAPNRLRLRHAAGAATLRPGSRRGT